MFARTKRLLLRPGWANDAPELAAAIADKRVIMQLASAPWPYGLEQAEAFLAMPTDPVLPTFLIALRTDGAPKIIGACGLGRRPSGAVEIGYWIARSHWGQGYASEACEALIDIARILGLTSLEGSHFVDNPASGRVLQKLGFVPTGLTAPRFSCGRGVEQDSAVYTLDLAPTQRQVAA
ncbi:GNAT family N-acetyltransferase [Sphingomicrobium flavum]|uniref:GNAT family N-acetyltransferase n=1 Tax=Sphingomicrobium flavum TaxID=1229164 RepID=UPI0021ADDCE3|nr:GNAT family N-acetyltransferase [Sphingomicrobium flavum]